MPVLYNLINDGNICMAVTEDDMLTGETAFFAEKTDEELAVLIEIW